VDIRVAPHARHHRLSKGLVTAALGLGLIVVPIPLLSGVAGAATVTSYVPGTPTVDTITNGTSAAPWNESQGDPASALYDTQAPGTLLPTYTPGGVSTGSGASAEPNVAVYPSASSGTDGVSPYPSGTVGTPGPLDGYCGTGNQTTASAGTPARQPAGTTLPFAPAYFPHVVKNADGSLTGYFDYRPKDADEALVAARSTDNGKSWTYEGEALEQNPGYCPSGDINDDGQGHANLITAGGTTRLYTLQRPAGDNTGIGMLVHTPAPTATDPLAGLPASEKVGIDPDAFVPPGDGVSVAATGGTAVSIALNTVGTPNSPEQLLPGGFVDLTQDPVPTASTVINCTGVGASSLTGCTTTSPSGLSVAAGDLIEQVIGYVNGAVTVPTGPNTSTGDGGLGTVNVVTTSGGSTKGFTNAITGTTLNTNAPNRAYINGVAVYCDQSNANPTTKIEDCTTGPGGPSLSVATGAPITSDPIVPATAQVTSGLIAPDGIVGTLPSYPNNGSVPVGATYVVYTEKELAYFVAGTTTNSSSAAFSSSIPFLPSPYESADMPATISASNPVTVQIGDTTSSTIVPVTCTGLTTGATDTLTGCSGFTTGDKYSSTSWIGAPGATTVSAATLAQTGEGSTSTAKLFKNNEDLTLLRVAYTTDGINFSSAGLDNGGIISGASNGASNYQDVNNPTSTTSPANLNAYATAGTADATEMRWVGSAGSIITNPDGSYGMFLSGAWAADGDSDAFNQIFYTQSTDGEHWSVPTTVISTDYTFSASAAQDAARAKGVDAPLGISAYYSGRAYGPSVIQNPDGTLTMIFAGYRSPKPIVNAGTVLGTNASSPWTVGATDPALYRNILTVTLTSSTSPGVGTTTSVTANPAAPVVGQPVTLTATVGVPSPGTGTPTGSVSFSGSGGPLCSGPLSETTPDTASCTTTYTSAISDTITASYGGDSNYATSSGTTSLTVAKVPTTTTVASAPNPSTFGQSATFTATVTPTDGGGTVSFAADGSATPISGCGGATLNLVAGSQVATCTTSALGGGTHVITATYSGDGTYAPSSGTLGGGQVVNPVKTTTTVASSVDPVVYGNPVTFTATVSPSDGGGTVSFYPDGSATPIAGCAGVALNAVKGNEVATCTTQALTGGTHQIAAIFSGDANDATSGATLPGGETVVVATSLTTTSVGVISSLLSLSTTFSATLTTLSGGAGLAGQTVSFSIGSINECSAVTNSAGVATCSTNVLGIIAAILLEHSTATFAGTPVYEKSTASAPVTLL
jgi:hypothetical protein